MTRFGLFLSAFMTVANPSAAENSPIELYFGVDKNQGYPHTVDLSEGSFSNYKLTLGFSNPNMKDEGVFVQFPHDDSIQGEYQYSYVLGVNEQMVTAEDLQPMDGVIFLAEDFDYATSECLFVPRGYNEIYHSGPNGNFDRIILYLNAVDAETVERTKCMAMERRYGLSSI